MHGRHARKTPVCETEKTTVAGGLPGVKLEQSYRRHGACGVHSLVVCSRNIGLDGLGHRGLTHLLLGQVSVARLGCSSSCLKKYLSAKQKKGACIRRSVWNEQGMSHRKHEACGVLQRHQLGRLGPSRARTPADGTGVCRPAGMSKLLPGKIPACKTEEKAAIARGLTGTTKE